jgi:predicted enzyme related to lactoylglutathione lyase
MPPQTAPNSTPRITPWAFVLAVHDLERSAEYYRDVLGFRLSWQDVAGWRLAERDGMRLMLGHCPNDMAPADIGCHNWYGYVNVDDLDAFHAEVTARGATCTAPADRPYGMREIVVTTVDGHRIVFGQDIAAGRPD